MRTALTLLLVVIPAALAVAGDAETADLQRFVAPDAVLYSGDAKVVQKIGDEVAFEAELDTSVLTLVETQDKRTRLTVVRSYRPKAEADGPAGPWRKRYDIAPFRPKPDTYYLATASPGQIVKSADGYRIFFSAATASPCKRTLGIARTKDLDRPWRIDAKPIVSPEEQIENSSLYYEPAHKTWFLFTNHIGINKHGEYTDAVWVYWSHDLDRWNPRHKAVVLDGRNCTWSRACIGLPSVMQIGKRLAILYDAPGGDSTSHMHRHVGLAWLELPLVPPTGS